MPWETSGKSWAKAPDQHDETLREATRRDREELLTSGLRPVECSACQARVLVRKTSMRQTSIQWTTEAASGCAEFAARLAAEPTANSALMDTCAQLRKSIERAVLDGLLEVPDG